MLMGMCVTVQCRMLKAVEKVESIGTRGNLEGLGEGDNSGQGGDLVGRLGAQSQVAQRPGCVVLHTLLPCCTSATV